MKSLAKMYYALAIRLRLTENGEFSGKLSATEDLVYIYYPRHGLGPSRSKAIVTFMHTIRVWVLAVWGISALFYICVASLHVCLELELAKKIKEFRVRFMSIT